MHRSSESVAALAAALAKAQAELVNPEKSLTATIRSGRPGEAERTFRYAPLSSGLDIVRKTLGQHEIATVQSTSIDQAAGVVNLTTMLAHASGEWIASDWPVCAVADMASPHRMGAALTYARRYALFTLVGIAGEDDLDAPDLQKGSAPTPIIPLLCGRCSRPIASLASSIRKRTCPPSRESPPPPVLPPAQSAVVRDRLLVAVADLQSGEPAAFGPVMHLPRRTPSSRLMPKSWRRPSSTSSLNCLSQRQPRNGQTRTLSGANRLQSRQTARRGCSRRRTARRHRQERPFRARAAALSQPRAPAVRRPTAVPGLRPQALRPPPPALHAAARARPQSQ